MTAGPLSLAGPILAATAYSFCSPHALENPFVPLPFSADLPTVFSDEPIFPLRRCA